MYQTSSLNQNIIVRLSDGANIPTDPLNADYQKFLEWQEAGGQVQLPEVMLDNNSK